MDYALAAAARVANVLNHLESLEYTLEKFFIELFASSEPSAMRARSSMKQHADFLIWAIHREGSSPEELLRSVMRVTQFAPAKAVETVLLSATPSAPAPQTIQHLLPLLHKLDPSSTADWCISVALDTFTGEMASITRPNAGFRGNVHHITPEQLESFNLTKIVQQMASSAPALWNLILHLLGASDQMCERRGEPAVAAGLHAAGVEDLLAHDSRNSSDDEDAVDPDAVPTRHSRSNREHAGSIGALLSGSSGRADRSELWIMRAATIFSMFLQSNSLHSNLLQTFVGMFMYLQHTQDKAMVMLNHAGVTVSRASCEASIRSLNVHHARKMRALGKTHLIQLVCDNFNFHERVAVPTVDRQSSYVSMISALAIRSHPDLTADDFAHVEHLYRHNTAVRMPRIGENDVTESFDWLYQQELPDRLMRRISKLTGNSATTAPFDVGNYWHETYSYHILNLLLSHHPRFKRLLPLLGSPPAVLRVPPAQTDWEPLRAMDLNQASNDDTIAALENMFGQIGLTNEDAASFVTFVHGDLTGVERTLSAMRTRAFEHTALNQLRNVVPVMGLFHACLASAESIQRVICDQMVNEQQPGLFKYIRELLPRKVDHNKFRPANEKKSPPYRLAHDTHSHLAAAMVYESMRHEAGLWNPLYSTLEKLADRLDLMSLDEAYSLLKVLASKVATRCVAGRTMSGTRKQPLEERDQVFENNQLYLRHVLIHLDLVNAVKFQDAGRILLALCRLMFIWAGSGKFKYAAHTLSVLSQVEAVLPDPMFKAFLYSWTVNLSGKEGEGRAVDWLNELFNFYIKVCAQSIHASQHSIDSSTQVMHCGRSSNFGRDHMSKMSSLIRMHKIVFDSFVVQYHLHGTKKHARPNMHETLEKVSEVMKDDGVLHYCADRRAGVEVKDALAAGQLRSHKGELKPATAADETPLKFITLELEDFD